MSVPPYSMGIFETIVGVHFGGTGGRFVGASTLTSGDIFTEDFPAVIYNCQMASAKATPVVWNQNKVFFPVPPGGKGHVIGTLNCSAYGKPNGVPTFVVGGDAVTFLNTTEVAAIQTSTDGINFHTTYFGEGDESGGFISTFVYALVWDNTAQAFFAAVIRDVSGSVSEDLLQSSTGTSWTRVGRQSFGAIPPNYTSLLDSHCTGQITNANGHPLPGGLFGYNKSKQMLIAPNPAPLWHAGEFSSSDSIQIQTPKGTTIQSIGMDTVLAVTYAGGIWQAAGEDGSGNGLISVSIDDGKTWSSVFSGIVGPLTLSGAPKTDFKKK